MRKLIFLVVISMLFVTGCASRNFHPRVELFGSYKDTSEINKIADEMKWAEAADIEVFVGTFPEGIDYNDGKITVDPNAGYVVMGKVYTNMSTQSSFFWFGDYPEDESWKKGYCHWQVPLKWLTLNMWNLTGMYYTCYHSESNDSEDIDARKSRIIKTLRKAAKAAGGDLLIVTHLGQTETVDAKSGRRLGMLDMTGASGFILKRIPQSEMPVESVKNQDEGNSSDSSASI